MPLTQADWKAFRLTLMAGDVEMEAWRRCRRWTTRQAITYSKVVERSGSHRRSPLSRHHLQTAKRQPVQLHWLSCLEKKPNASHLDRGSFLGRQSRRPRLGAQHPPRRTSVVKEVGDSVEVYEIALQGRGTRAEGSAREGYVRTRREDCQRGRRGAQWRPSVCSRRLCVWQHSGV